MKLKTIGIILLIVITAFATATGAAIYLALTSVFGG